MKSKIVETLVPPMVGITIILGVLLLFHLVQQQGMVRDLSDPKFFRLFVPIAAVCAFMTQYFLVLPLWKRYSKRGRIMGMRWVLFTIIITLVSGFIFSLIFWEKNAGLNDFIALVVTGVGAFALYWPSNFFLLKLLNWTS